MTTQETVIAQDEVDISSFEIRDVTVTVEGVTPYSQSSHPGEEKQ